MRVIGLAGWSGAGKTTLLVKLIPELKGRGLSVSTVKHAHHEFDVDQPGKDSFRHREAGADEVLIASRRRVAIVQELRDRPEPGLSDLLSRLSPVDLVIVEGFKRSAHSKIEIHRSANGRPFLFPDVPGILALATDILPVIGAPLPVISLDDVPAVADAALAHALPLAEVLGLLASEPLPGPGGG